MSPSLSQKVGAVVARGLLGAGEARRVALVGLLSPSPPQADSQPIPTLVSGECLGRSLGLSRAAVHKHVEHLRALGFAVDSVGGAGYRLARPFTDLVVPEAVLPFLLGQVEVDTGWVAGLPYRYLARCDSTNRVLRQVASGSPSGTAVVTDEQTGGRGRLGRAWVSAPGKDLTFSVLLHPALAPAEAHLLSLAAALATAEALEAIPDLEGEMKVKWPNDVLLDGKKVCGILLEGSMDADRIQWAIAGIGLNVNSEPSAMLRDLPPEDRRDWLGRPEPVSLREHLGREVARAPLLTGLLLRLTQRWTEVKTADLLERLRDRDALAGRRVEVRGGPPGNEPVVVGEALGIGPEGQLLVKNRAGETVPVFAGEVTVREAKT
jgi:BirA family transcriptional regulator, biotin operon repressor / biotin---[acetyl-CoA-carboxylase] ligase